MSEDIRWIQRLNNWTRALNQLKIFLGVEELNDLEKQGLIQSFEYNHELAWKTVQDYLRAQGFVDITGPRGNTRKAFEEGLLEDGDVWMEMIKSRNETVHTYNEETTKKIVNAIVDDYFSAFCDLHQTLSERARQEQSES